MKANYYNKAIETMPRSQLEVLQGERLHKLTAYVYERVPFYRAKMDALKVRPSDIKTIHDIVKLPFTEKSDLRDNYPFGLFAVPKKEVVRLHASSGTTGKLTVVGYTQNDIDAWSEAMARSLACAGVTSDSTVHVAYGYGMFTGGLGAHYGAEKIGARVVPISSGNTARQLMLLKDFEATTLCCTPSYAAYIAEALKEGGYKIADFRLNAGVFGAEPWSEGMRAHIQKELNLQAFDIYGLSEITGPGVSMECCRQDGLHVWEDLFYPEILDQQLSPCASGTQGELVFTTLCKEAMPLLRYRTRDLCTLNTAVCKCGRTHARMGKILGRSDDMLIIRGVNVFPSQIETVLLDLGYASPNYRLVVERHNNTDTLDVEFELSPDMFSGLISGVEKIRDEIKHKIYSATGLNAGVRLVEQGTIPRSEGKAKRVLDNRKI
ncbi:MAG: phenylacetate--CoA ligase [Firmicutes bacterium]|nr:phenylacetate--CoA ligase [Bacillota bacterium]